MPTRSGARIGARLRSLALVVVAVATIAVVVPAAPVAALAPVASSYAWAIVRETNPEGGTYALPAADHRSSVAGGVTMTKVSRGIYAVSFANLGSYASVDNGGNVQVAALNGRLRICSIDNAGPSGTDYIVNVDCVRHDGDPAESPFIVTVTHVGPATSVGGTAVAYAYDDQSLAGATPTAVDPTWQYATGGGTTTSAHTATGTYVVQTDSIAPAGGATLVTGYWAGRSCRIESWYPDSGSLTQNLRCAGPDGSPVDSVSSILFVDQTGFSGFAPRPSAYAWANRDSAASYKPMATYRWSSKPAAPRIVRAGTGDYRVTFPKQPGGGAAIVSAYGPDFHTCQVTSIATSKPATVGVRCFDGAGARSDSRFVIVWTK